VPLGSKVAANQRVICQPFAKWWLTGGSEQSFPDASLKIVN
jgi:hypothetical protein